MVENAKTESHVLDKRYANRTLVLFGLAVMVVMYVEIMMVPSLPKMSLEYNVSLGQTTLVLALYTVFGTAITPIVGKLGDIYGKKKMLVYALIAYSAMVTVTSFTTDFNTLLISRTFQGIGLAVIPLAFSLAREQYPVKMIPRAQALISGMVVGGIGLGLSAGAYVSNFYGWQSNYHLAAPASVFLTFLIFINVRESSYRNPHARLDYFGSAILGTVLAMIVLALAEGSQWGWSSVLILSLMSLGSLLLVPLVLIEKRVKEPLLDFQQLRARNVMVSNVVALTSSAAILTSFTSMVYLLEYSKPAGYGYGILTTGLYILPFAVVTLVASYPVGILNSKVGVKPVLLFGSLVGALGFLLISTQTTAIQIPEYVSLGAIGIAMVIVSRQVLLVLSVKPSEMGSLTSINQVFQNVGQSLGAPIAASMLSTITTSAFFAGNTFSYPSAQAFQYAFLLCSGFFFVSLFAGLFAKEVIKRRRAPALNISSEKDSLEVTNS